MTSYPAGLWRPLIHDTCVKCRYPRLNRSDLRRHFRPFLTSITANRKKPVTSYPVWLFSMSECLAGIFDTIARTKSMDARSTFLHASCRRWDEITGHLAAAIAKQESPPINGTVWNARTPRITRTPMKRSKHYLQNSKHFRNRLSRHREIATWTWPKIDTFVRFAAGRK